MAFTADYNIHTHSHYCGHGTGEVHDYVEEASAWKLGLLGFSEHCPFPDHFLKRSRMDISMMPAYEADVREVAKTAPFPILLGYECDYFTKYHDYFKDLKDSGRLDYLVTGTHFIIRPDGRRVTPFSDELVKEDLWLYYKQMEEAVSTGFFDFIAHPDLFMAGYAGWDAGAQALARDVIQLSLSSGLPLEVNSNGLHKPQVAGRAPYPHEGFWRLASELGAPAVISSDAHKPGHLCADRGMVEEWVLGLGIKLVKPVFKPGRLEWDRG